MELYAIEHLATELMINNKSGKNLFDMGWSFSINTRGTRFMGRCKYRCKTIEVAKHFAAAMSIEDATDTILHEIAHALTPGSGHGLTWQSMCRTLGCNPKSAGTVENYDLVISKFAVVFKNAEGIIEKVGEANRTLKNLARRFVTGRKDETLGNLFMMRTAEYNMHVTQYKIDGVGQPETKSKGETKAKATNTSKNELPDNSTSLGLYLRTFIKDVITKPMTVTEIYTDLMFEYEDEITKRVPTHVNFGTFVRSKITDSCKREKAIKDGVGKNATWSF